MSRLFRVGLLTADFLLFTLNGHGHGLPSAPAFWDAAANAAGVPASHEQRGRVVGSRKVCDNAARTPAASF